MPTPATAVRPMRWDDIPRILRIAEESSSCWIRADFRAVFQSHETLGFVAESADRIVVGFALCAVERDCNVPDRGRLSWWRRWKRLLGGGQGGAAPWETTRRINLFALAASRDAQDAGVESALLKHFERGLRSPRDRLEAVVPETDAGAQTLLREAGFLAVRVVPGYYCHIDGYLMTRENRLALAAGDCEIDRQQVKAIRRISHPPR